MNDRDALIGIIEACTPRPVPESRKMATNILAAGWRPPARMISTAAELDELQSAAALLDSGRGERSELAAVIRDARGFVYSRDMHNLEEEVVHGRPAGWWEAGTSRDDRDSTTMTFPVTVLLDPTEEADHGE
ncbi:hypothetical protein [Nocardia sp. A7]|uniref:hypothetical protein n=1 Tax=Nocardia sp. A7 TaxID=2789274 RepID=UPI00397C3049